MVGMIVLLNVGGEVFNIDIKYNFRTTFYETNMFSLCIPGSPINHDPPALTSQVLKL
jgi:hypothetical protein